MTEFITTTTTQGFILVLNPGTTKVLKENVQHSIKGSYSDVGVLTSNRMEEISAYKQEQQRHADYTSTFVQKVMLQSHFPISRSP